MLNPLLYANCRSRMCCKTNVENGVGLYSFPVNLQYVNVVMS